MKWVEVELLTPVTTIDELGNKVDTGRFITSGIINARYTPFEDKETLVSSGIKLTKDTQRYMLPIKYALLDSVRYISVDGKRYKVLGTEDLSPRWSVIYVEKYRKN